MEREEAIEIISGWAEREPLVREVYIFGSRARNSHRPDSDLDVAVKVIAQPGDSSEYACWMFESDGLTKRLQQLLPVTLQLEWYHPEKTPHVHMGIIESSIKVYEKAST